MKGYWIAVWLFFCLQLGALAWPGPEDEIGTVTWGEAVHAVLTVSASGEVTVLDWRVPHILGLRFAAVLHARCSADLWDTAWLLWDTLIDEAGRSAWAWSGRQP